MLSTPDAVSEMLDPKIAAEEVLSTPEAVSEILDPKIAAEEVLSTPDAVSEMLALYTAFPKEENGDWENAVMPNIS